MPDLLLPYLGLIVLLTLTPGPDMLLVLRNGLHGGSRLAWATGAGCCTGIAVHAVAATLGLSAVLAASATAFTVLKYVGAAYLVWLGVTAILSTTRVRRPTGETLHALASASARQVGDELGPRSAFRQGLLSNLLNPKIALLFLTLLPQFIAPGEPRLETTVVLAACFVAVGLVFMRLFSLLVGPLARLLSRARVGLWIERVTGTALIGLGVGVALERR